jgi:signal transduction histidine kinase
MINNITKTLHFFRASLKKNFQKQNKCVSPKDHIQGKLIKTEQELHIKSSILNSVSHEIKTFIHGIGGISEFLVKEWDELNDEERKIQITVILKSSSRFKVFIDSLLDFSRASVDKLELNFTPMNLTESVNKAVKECRELYLFDSPSDKIKFTYEKCDNTLILGDPLRIHQVLINLLTNAIKYAKKSEIKVHLSAAKYEKKDYLELSVIDKGVGIPDEELESIFEPFAQGSKAGFYGGSGLGLSLCREIISSHEGRIWAENNLDKGAKFTFIVPAL